MPRAFSRSLIGLAAALFAVPVLAQEGADGGLSIPVTATAQPGEAGAEVVRESGLAVEPAAPPMAEPDAGVPAAPVPAPGEPAKVAALLAIPPASPSVMTERGLSAGVSAWLRGSGSYASPFPVDSDLNRVQPNPVEVRLRVTPELRYRGFGLVAEVDALTGAIPRSLPSESLVGRNRMPVLIFHPIELRQLYAEFRWKTGLFRVGQQTSDWGLGLLANGGARDNGPGDFNQTRFGNLTWRALVAGRPLFGLGGAWRALELALAGDLIVRDNFAEFSLGDRAFQGVLSARFKKDEEHWFGVYAVYRKQTNVNVSDGGKTTEVAVIDAAGSWSFLEREDRALKIGAEVVGLIGSTTQARSDTAPIAAVRQFGAAAKSSYRYRDVQVYFDFGFMSGDQNPYDDRIENFRADRDFKVGLVLFDQVAAYQSARGSIRAQDKNLVGVAPEGADLLPTAGSLTGTWYVYPRLRVGPTDWLDIYGGPLLAFGTAAPTDPFNTRITGGTPVNALGAAGGRFLGTELDLGVQLRAKPWRSLLLSATVEGGLFLPGDAFKLPDGTVMAPVGLGRLVLSVKI